MKSKKASILVVVAVISIVLLEIPTAMSGRQLLQPPHNNPTRVTVGIAGSRLPDCSHACGSCWPCRLVMVRFFCASSWVEDSETCPLAYKCMCSHTSFPVP